MKKYICVDKKTLKVKNFASFMEEESGKYRVADLDKGIILKRIFDTEKSIKVLLEVHYNIK